MVAAFSPLIVALAIGALAIIAVIVLVVVLLARRPTRAPAQQSGAAPPAGVAPAAWQWNAHLRREGHLDGFSGFGTLTLWNGALTFQPEGATSPAWSYPAVSFGIWSDSPLANNDLVLDSQPTGKLGVTLSHQRINRVSENDVKFLRQRGVAAEFVQAMQAAGATIR